MRSICNQGLVELSRMRGQNVTRVEGARFTIYFAHLIYVNTLFIAQFTLIKYFFLKYFSQKYFL